MGNFRLGRVITRTSCIRRSVSNIANGVLANNIVTVTVLLVFLEGMETAFVVKLSVPASVLLAFATV